MSLVIFSGVMIVVICVLILRWFYQNDREEMKKGLWLFIDDAREPPSASWIHARSSAEAIKLLESHGLRAFETISFDHDLGEVPVYGSDGEPTGETKFDDTGRIIEWIEEAVFIYHQPIPPYLWIHTQNPVERRMLHLALTRLRERVVEGGLDKAKAMI